MRTEDLIVALVADGATPVRSPTRLLLGGALAGGLVTAAIFAAAVGPRPDLAAALGSPRFLLKFVECGGLAGMALLLASRLTRPAADRRIGGLGLALVVAVVVAAAAAEAAMVPSGEWGRRLVGTNRLHCLVLVSLLALPPFVLMMAAARGGAATEPGRTGAVIGLAAGGIGAFFYAANCTDDSPLFVATWYTLAILALAALGGVVGRRVLRW